MQNMSTWIQRYPSLKLAQLLISSSERGNQGQGSMELSRAAINNMRRVEHALGFLATSTRARVLLRRVPLNRDLGPSLFSDPRGGGPAEC